MAVGLTHFGRIRLTGDDSAETIFQATDGVCKIHNRPSTSGYALEVKSEPTIVTGTHFGIETTVDGIPSTATSGAGLRGTGGICRLSATYTATSGSYVGAYGQVCNLGTFNGSGLMAAGVYGLIEDGGTYTAVSRVAAGWFDSHLDQTVTAGVADLLYLTNNGDTVFDNAIEVYAGNKITNLLSINTASGMVSANTAAGTTLVFTNWVAIKITIDGTTHYIPAAQTIAAS